MPGFLGVAAFLVGSSMISPALLDPPQEPDLFSPAGVLTQLGLTPITLAGTGADGEDVEGCVNYVAGSGACTNLEALFNTLGSAATPQAIIAALAVLDAAKGDLREDVFEELPSVCAGQFPAISTGVDHGLPADLAAVVCDTGGAAEAQRVKVMLIAERRAQRMGRALDQAIATELAALRAHPTAVAIRANLASNLADVEEVFDAAWSSEVPPP